MTSVNEGEAPERPIAPAGPSATASLNAKLARSTGWIVGGTYLTRIMGLISTLALTWYLSPADFGVFAIGLSFLQLLTGFTEVGLSMAVVRFRDASDDDLDTLFTIGALRGLLLGAVMLGAGPVAAQVYDEPRLLVVFWGLAAVPVVNGLINPRFYEFEREGDFSREFLVMLISKTASVALTIGLAFWLRSYVAFVAGLIASGVVQTGLSFLLRPSPPRLTFASLDKVFGFTGWITLVAIFAALNNKLDVLFFGRIVGEAKAGQLYLGSSLAELPTRDVSVPVARAIYPGLSERQDDPEAVRLGFLEGCQALALLALPASVGFALVADLLLPLLGQGQWTEAVPVVQIFGPVLGLQTVFAATQAYAMSVGRVSVVGLREAVFFVVRTPVILWALSAYGYMGGLWAVAAMGVMHCGLNALAYWQLSGRNPAQPLLATRRSVLATGAMALAVLGLRTAMPDALPALASAALLIASGAVSYAVAQVAFWVLEGRPDGIERSVAALLLARLSPATP